jgi:hypothetical protein
MIGTRYALVIFSKVAHLKESLIAYTLLGKFLDETPKLITFYVIISDFNAYLYTS